MASFAGKKDPAELVEFISSITSSDESGYDECRQCMYHSDKAACEQCGRLFPSIGEIKGFFRGYVEGDVIDMMHSASGMMGRKTVTTLAGMVDLAAAFEGGGGGGGGGGGPVPVRQQVDHASAGQVGGEVRLVPVEEVLRGRGWVGG